MFISLLVGVEFRPWRLSNAVGCDAVSLSQLLHFRGLPRFERARLSGILFLDELNGTSRDGIGAASSLADLRGSDIYFNCENMKHRYQFTDNSVYLT